MDNQTGKIAYTIKDNRKNVFVTGIMPNDATLTERLEQSGAKYTAVIPQQNSFLMDMLMWLVPIIVHSGRRFSCFPNAGEENGREHDDVWEIQRENLCVGGNGQDVSGRRGAG